MNESRVAVSLGVTESGDTVGLDLVTDAAHIAIQGMTRSGKSQMNYNLLAQVATLPHVRVVGFDLTGLLLAPFVERGESRIASGAGEVERIPDVLDWLNALVVCRTEALRDFRLDKQVVFDEDRPLILAVCEEFDATLEAAADDDAAEGRKPGDRIEPQIRRGVRRLAALSAKAGVRLVLTTQRAEANVLGGASRSNFGTRVTFRVDNPDSVRMLHPSAIPEVCERVELFAPGVALLDRSGSRRVVIRGPLTSYADYYARVLDEV